MRLELRKVRSATVVAVLGSIRAEDNQRFAQVLRELSTPGCRVILDAAGLDYVNSRALGELVKFVQEVRPKGGVIAVVSPTTLVEKILRAVGLFSLIKTYGAVEEAVEAWEL